jgi:hypothetical protein
VLLPLSEQRETTAALNQYVVFESNSRSRIYCICADSKRRIGVSAIAKDPDRRGTAMQSVQLEEISVMRVAEKHTRGDNGVSRLAFAAVASE